MIPLLTSKFKPRSKQIKRTIIDKLSDKYSVFLAWFIARRWISTISIILLFFSIAIPILLGLNIDMFPNNPERELDLRYNLNASYTLDRVKETVDKVEDYLYANQENFEIESVYTYYTPEFALSTIILIEEADAKSLLSSSKKRSKRPAGGNYWRACF